MPTFWTQKWLKSTFLIGRIWKQNEIWIYLRIFFNSPLTTLEKLTELADLLIFLDWSILSFFTTSSSNTTVILLPKLDSMIFVNWYLSNSFMNATSYLHQVLTKLIVRFYLIVFLSSSLTTREKLTYFFDLDPKLGLNTSCFNSRSNNFYW